MSAWPTLANGQITPGIEARVTEMLLTQQAGGDVDRDEFCAEVDRFGLRSADAGSRGVQIVH